MEVKIVGDRLYLTSPGGMDIEVIVGREGLRRHLRDMAQPDHEPPLEVPPTEE